MVRKAVIFTDSPEGGIFTYCRILHKEINDKDVIFMHLKNRNIIEIVKFYISFFFYLAFSEKLILDVHSLIWPIEILILPIMKLKGHVFILDAHDDPLAKKLKFRPLVIRKILFRASDMVVAHSKYSLKICKRFNKKTVYIPLGPHLDKEFKLDLKATKKKFNLEKNIVGLFFGYIQPNKGLDVLLNSMPIVLEKHKNFKLMIAGEPKEDFSKYDKIIQKFGLEKNVIKILNYFRTDDERFGLVDFFILPHREITQSGVPFIAYMMKKPVISSNIGGFKEVVKDGKTGLIFESGNEKGLADKINKLIESEKNRIEFGKNGYEMIVSGEFSWKSISKNYLELFKKF